VSHGEFEKKNESKVYALVVVFCLCFSTNLIPFSHFVFIVFFIQLRKSLCFEEDEVCIKRKYTTVGTHIKKDY